MQSEKLHEYFSLKELHVHSYVSIYTVIRVPRSQAMTSFCVFSLPEPRVGLACAPHEEPEPLLVPVHVLGNFGS